MRRVCSMEQEELLRVRNGKMLSRNSYGSESLCAKVQNAHLCMLSGISVNINTYSSQLS